MKTRCGIVIVLVAAAALLVATLPAQASTLTLNPYERQLVQYINDVRSDHHLPKLRLNAKLEDAARAHSTDMGKRQYFEHDSLGGQTWSARIMDHGYTYQGFRLWKAGEDIAWGAGLSASPAAIFDGWMHSAPHRAVILGKAFRDIGVGAVSCDGYGSVDGTVWFFTFDAGRRSR